MADAYGNLPTTTVAEGFFRYFRLLSLSLSLVAMAAILLNVPKTFLQTPAFGCFKTRQRQQAQQLMQEPMQLQPP